MKRRTRTTAVTLWALMFIVAAGADQPLRPEASEPGAVPQASATDLAYQQWAEGLYAELGRSENPAFRLVAGWHWLISGELALAEAQFRTAAAHPDLDTAGLRALVEHCSPSHGWEWCDIDGWKQRLTEMDPQNANTWLLQLVAEETGDGSRHWNTPANRAWLSKAADAKHISGYYAAHATNLFEAVMDYSRRYPEPVPDADTLALIEDDELRAMVANGDTSLRPYTALGLSVLTPWTSSFRTLGATRELCKAQWPEGDPNSRRDCQALARLGINTADTWIDRRIMGLSLVQIRDEATGEDEHARQEAIMNWEQLCTMPAWMTGLPHILRATEPVARQYIAEAEALGEIEANQRAAIRDYALAPEAYDHDPAECPNPGFPDIDWTHIQ